VGWNVAALVQPVDVLGDQQGDAACTRQVGEGAVCRIRLRRTDHLPGLALVAPVPFAGLFAGEKLLERDRAVLRPAAARGAEVRDAGGGGEPGTGEHDHPLGVARGRGEALDRAVGRWVAHGTRSYAGRVRNSANSSSSTSRSTSARASSKRSPSKR